jgi:hypothetical protein
MAADFNPLDTSQRNKVLAMIQQLADAGLSDQEILGYFQQAQGLGQKGLADYFNQAGAAIGAQFEPQFETARNTLGASPLLADSGYANRLNRQLLTDLGTRLSGDYASHAAEEASRNLGFYRSLVGERTGLRSGLANQAYQTFTGLPKKKKIGQQLLEAGTNIAGSAVGALAGGPAGAVAGAVARAAHAREPSVLNYQEPSNYWQQPYQPRRRAYSPLD